MKETMGQIIRRLRKERNLTQEELAEQLGVTFQAVSKWENDTGMPDISQVVPIAHVFGVSTDVLFGTFGTSDTEEVWKIVNNAQALLSRPLTSESLFQKYLAIKEYNYIYIKKEKKENNNYYKLALQKSNHIENIIIELKDNADTDGNDVCRLNSKNITLPL